MILGTSADGKFVESFSKPEVTVSESEIAELEKPKDKEVKPKDVEGEKPKVSKVDKAAEVTSKTIFLKLYEKMKVHITDNPDMLYKDYWRNGEH